MRLLRLISLFVLVLPALLTTRAGRERDFEAMDTKELSEKGNEWLIKREDHPKALAAFSTIVNRYYKGEIEESENDDVIAAMKHIGTLHLVSFFKYDLAYKYLNLALTTSESLNDDHLRPYILLNLANLWEVNKMVFPESKYDGFTYVAQAWEAAKENGNEELLPVIATDMAILSYSNKDKNIFRSQLNEFASRRHNPSSSAYETAKDFTRGILAWLNGNPHEAEKHLLNALAEVEGIGSEDSTDSDTDKNTSERNKLSIISALCQLHIEAGNLTKAKEALDLYAASTEGNPDFEIDLNAMRMEYFKTIGTQDSLEHYHYLYLKGKENLSTENKLYNVNEQEFITRIEEINEDVLALSDKNRRQKTQLMFISAASLLLLILVWIAVWAYIRIRKKSEQLFEKNVAMIEERRQASQREEQLLRELEGLRERVQEPTDSQEIPKSAEAKPRTPVSEENSEELYALIKATMEAGGEVFSPDFSLERLAQLVGAKPRAVSYVINTKHGMNFPQFLNEYRIQEACIRFQNVRDYGNYTVEAIAESVGYRSRTGFSALFKKTTGLTPSEYQRLSKRAVNRD